MSTPSKNKKAVKTETSANEVPPTPAEGATSAVKKTKKVKVELPLTPAQVLAKEALAKADAEAREELVKNSAGKIADAEKAIADAKAVVAAKQAELRALKKAVGIKGVFGGQKITTFFFVKDFPEGKGAPQARAILQIVKAGGKTGVERAKVVETMKTAINTNMDRSRLLSYYTAKLIEAGVVSGAKVEAAK